MDILNPIPNQNRSGPVVLVSSPITFTYPFAYGYLAGYLRKFGEHVQVLMRPSTRHLGPLIQRIFDMEPLLVGMGSLYPDLNIIREIVRLLDAQRRNFPVVIGGQMVSSTPEFSMQITGADFGVIGEGEITLLKLVNALRSGEDPTGIKGLVIRQEETFLNTGPGEQIEDLSELPPVPLDIFPPENWLYVGRFFTSHAQPHWRYNDRVIPVHGSRGCPYRCNFCYLHSKVRYRKVSDMVGEAAENLERYDGNMVWFCDELTLSTPKRARELVDAIRQMIKRPIGYAVVSRFDILSRIDDDLLAEMKATGCRCIGMGIESGSQRILDVMKKGITVDQIRSGLTRLHRVGIVPSGAIQVGQYSETIDDVEASITLVRETVRENPNLIYVFAITTPFPGSPLYYQLLREGYLRDDEDLYNRYFSTPGSLKLVVNFSEMSDKTLLRMYDKIQAVYREEKKCNLGGIINMVESLRGFLERHDPPLRHCIRRCLSLNSGADRLPLIERAYQMVYDFTQTHLDHLRLRLRGF